MGGKHSKSSSNKANQPKKEQDYKLSSDKANQPEKEQDFKPSSDKANKTEEIQYFQNILWRWNQCSGSGQIPSQYDPNYHQFLSLYKTIWRKGTTELIIYDTESEEEQVKVLDTKLKIDATTCITQLPNGELFCYDNLYSGMTLIIDRRYRVKMLQSGTPCSLSSALYFENNIYCFGGYYNDSVLALSRKFDLKNKRWIDLPRLPFADYRCHSVIFNRNILISGCKSKNLWLYSTEINTFCLIPHDLQKIEESFWLMQRNCTWLSEITMDGSMKVKISFIGNKFRNQHNYLCLMSEYIPYIIKKKSIFLLKAIIFNLI